MEDTANRPVSSPLRRSLALGFGAVLGMGLIVGTRGTEGAYGLFLRLEPEFAVRDVLGFVMGALGVGIAVPLVAGYYIPGLPARAQCIAWAGVAASLRISSETETSLTSDVWGALLLGELLVLAACVWITTTACWLVDTRITFPRLYPDPADWPPAKHTTGRDVLAVHVPNALGLTLGISVLYRLIPSGGDPLVKPLAVAFGAAFVSHMLQRVRPSRGSIWAMMGVIAGVALGSLPLGNPTVGPWTNTGAPLTSLLTCAIAGYSVVLLRSRLRLSDVIATPPDEKHPTG